MQVLTYDEVDPYEALRIPLIAFGVPVRPRDIEVSKRRDPRVLPGYALYAMEGGRPVAQVLPRRMRVNLTKGPEEVGAIASVCSLPEVWGRGYVRSLMEHVHTMYRDMGFSLSTLMTSRNIRGYGLYLKLGYGTSCPFPWPRAAFPGPRPGPVG